MEAAIFIALKRDGSDDTSENGKRKLRPRRKNPSENLKKTCSILTKAIKKAGFTVMPMKISSDDENEDSSSEESSDDEALYCICEKRSTGWMIECDNDLCPQQWFHFRCVGLRSRPKGKWFCPRCRGDRPDIKKPMAELINSLVLYNKAKEEEFVRQNRIKRERL